jgi:uncharacterized protein (DUF4415 family)
MQSKNPGAGNAWVDRDDAPRLTSGMVRAGGPLPRRQEGSLEEVEIRQPEGGRNLRLEPDVLTYFRKTGPGWRSRIDEASRKRPRDSSE